jgi:hypothetical protein
MKVIKKTKLGKMYLISEEELKNVEANSRCELANYILFCFNNFSQNDDLFTNIQILKNIILFLSCKQKYIPNSHNNMTFDEYRENNATKKG